MTVILQDHIALDDQAPLALEETKGVEEDLGVGGLGKEWEPLQERAGEEVGDAPFVMR